MNIYLAGPDVFHPDAPARAAAARALLAEYGHRALLPVDNEATTAPAIYRANVTLIAEADAVIADLNPFRGCEPDSGTCFEIGYATALGKPVIGFLDDPRSCRDKVIAARGSGGSHNGRPLDGDGLYIEDFGLPANLMLAVSCRIVGGGLRQALAALAA